MNVRPVVDVGRVRKALYQLDMLRGRNNVSQAAYAKWEQEFVDACLEVARPEIARRDRLRDAMRDSVGATERLSVLLGVVESRIRAVRSAR